MLIVRTPVSEYGPTIAQPARDKGACGAGGSAGDAPLWRAKAKAVSAFHHPQQLRLASSFRAFGANRDPPPKLFRLFAPIRSNVRSMGRKELIDDPRFATPALRVKNDAELGPIVR
ncbi:MAG: hypothetical protein ABI377_07075, partial [Devosia sp.]